MPIPFTLSLSSPSLSLSSTISSNSSSLLPKRRGRKRAHTTVARARALHPPPNSAAELAANADAATLDRALVPVPARRPHGGSSLEISSRPSVTPLPRPRDRAQPVMWALIPCFPSSFGPNRLAPPLISSGFASLFRSISPRSQNGAEQLGSG